MKRASATGSAARWLSCSLGAAAALVVAACGAVGPPPVTYVLGMPPSVQTGVEPLLGRPVIELKPVLLPDYLDTSELLVRHEGNVVAPSLVGRWGERLSVGLTRALAGALTRRLPGVVITTTSTERPACEMLVDVETFERAPDALVGLVAQWRLLDGVSRRALAGERVSLWEPVGGPDDTATVTAMSRAIERFADGAAATIRRTGRPCGGPSIKRTLGEGA